MRWQAPYRTALFMTLAVLLAAAGGAAAQVNAPARDVEVLEQPVAVTAVRSLLYARAFTLRQPYVYPYLREAPAISRGTLLVLEVDPEVARPRDVDVPVLFAGDTPVHLTNSGYPSGRMIVFIPDGIDLAHVPVFFGSTELPERMDRARGALEANTAMARAARPFAPDVRAMSFVAGGATLELAGSVALFRAVADLIDLYAPEEHELAEIYRTPLVRE